MAKIKWPEEIPMPKAGQFCTGSLSGPKGSHCLVGWAMTAFPGGSYLNAYHEATSALRRVIRRRKPEASIVNFNDHWAKDDAERVAVWDEAMAALGYERTEEPWTP